MNYEYIVIVIVIFVIAIIIYFGLQSDNFVSGIIKSPMNSTGDHNYQNIDSPPSQSTRKKKRIKFNTKVERRDYDKETGDMLDRMTVKINDAT